MDLTEKKITQSIADRKRLHAEFASHVKSYAPLLELEKTAFADGSLDKRHKS